MKVEILAVTPDAMDIIWTAIRTCKSVYEPEVLFHDKASEKTTEEKLRLIHAIRKAGHDSVFEHVTMTFAISGVSRALLAQLTRHRIGVSYSVQSQRYVKMFAADSVIPASVAVDAETEELYVHAVQNAKGYYEALLNHGVKPEDARMVLPMGTECNMVFSCNLRSFLDIYHKRVAVSGAQWEIKELIQEMADKLKVRMPWVAELLSNKTKEETKNG